MGLDAYRQTEATHKRRVIDQTDMTATLTTIATIYIFGDNVATTTDTAELLDVEVPTFDIVINPDNDVRVGDILEISGVTHEVIQVRIPTRPPGYGEATIKRCEVHQ